ncbi:MAG: Calx-beta domain-containing protein, partial [Steroidobacteraceae bacterium]
MPTAADPIAFSSSSYSIAQNAGSISLTVIRSGAASASVSVDYATVDGTAVGGADYTATSGTLQWSENDSTSRTITIPVSSATPFSGNKSFQVALSDPSASAKIASPDVATVVISGDATASAGDVQFTALDYTVAQNAGALTVAVNRSGGSIGAASVVYATSNGSAIAGTDFTATTGTLDWTSGDAASKTISIPISNAKAFSGGKTFSIALSTPSGATLGTPGVTTVTITGDSSPGVGSLHLSASSESVAQNAGSLTFTVDRVGGFAGAVSVAYTTKSGTAVAGKDFSSASGTLSWTNGDAGPKTFSIAISDAAPFSGGKVFTVALSQPGGGATIASPSSSTVTITGGGTAAVGSLGFSAATYGVAQNGGNAVLTVDRVGGSSGQVTVAYGSTSGTAVSSTNFTAATGSLTWANGDATPKTISIAISNATPFTGTKSFNVALSNPSGGSTLDGTSSAAVTISGVGGTGGTPPTGGSGGPGAPGNFQMTHQGASDAVLTWSAAAAGANPVDHYKIYRNG